jgi:excisionase family DNA binding protein
MCNKGRPRVYLTVKEASARLRISRLTVIRALKAGRLKGFKTSPGRTGQWRITEESYNAYVSGEASR